ncbi:MAG TPA: aldo/keto reductase [Nitrososphaerales archaeon]|nr:aldo/keto reductase [Nitrososphaerales archaeon]
MRYVNLGNTGLKVSKLCFGTMGFGNAEEWMIEKDEARKLTDRAINLGINFFDTANLYSTGRSEEIVGEVLKDYRDDIVLATKLFFPMGQRPNDRGLSRYHIMREMERSLERLQTDHVDLLQTHRWDYETPVEETLVALDDLIHAGKIRYIGGSTMYAWQFTKAIYTSRLLGISEFVSMQDQYNLCYREEEREVIPLLKDQKIAMLPWSPLARGFLTGKYKRDEKPDSPRYRSDKPFGPRFFRPEDFDVLDVVEAIAKERGVTPSQIALAWVLNHDFVTSPIVGVTKMYHLEEAIQAMDIHLSKDEMDRLEKPYKLRAITPPQ